MGLSFEREMFSFELNQSEPTNYEGWEVGTPLPAFPAEYNGIPVTSLTSMFCDCTKMESIDISAWDTSNIVNMDKMFCNCTSLTMLDLSTWNFENTESMNEMFSGCTTTLEKVYIENTSMAESFQSNTGFYRTCVKSEEGDLQFVHSENLAINKYCS